MVEIHFLSGKRAGHIWAPARFPFSVGSGAENDLVIPDGSWALKHGEVVALESRGWVWRSQKGQVVQIGGEVTSDRDLHAGECVEWGQTRFRFVVLPVVQRDGRRIEQVVWGLLAIVTIVELFLMGWFLR